MARCPAHGNRIQLNSSRAVNLFGATPQPKCCLTVGNQGTRRLNYVAMDPLQQGQRVHRVAGLVAYADRHDRLVVAIDRGLAAVLTLDPAVKAYEAGLIQSISKGRPQGIAPAPLPR